MYYHVFSWIKESTNIEYFSAGTSPHAVSSATVTTEMNQANVSWVPGFDGGYTQKFTVWWGTYLTFYYAALSCPQEIYLICLHVHFGCLNFFTGSNRHPEGNMNGHLCLCQHPKTTCWWLGYLLALAISLVSYPKINSALDLLVKLFLCELKVCDWKFSLSLMPFASKNVSHWTFVSFHQLCQQRNLQSSTLLQSWILLHFCQPTELSKAFSSSGCPLWLHPLHWQALCCKPAGIRASGSSSAATSMPIRVNSL